MQGHLFEFVDSKGSVEQQPKGANETETESYACQMFDPMPKRRKKVTKKKKRGKAIGLTESSWRKQKLCSLCTSLVSVSLIWCIIGFYWVNFWWAKASTRFISCANVWLSWLWSSVSGEQLVIEPHRTIYSDIYVHVLNKTEVDMSFCFVLMFSVKALFCGLMIMQMKAHEQMKYSIWVLPLEEKK